MIILLFTPKCKNSIRVGIKYFYLLISHQHTIVSPALTVSAQKAFVQINDFYIYEKIKEIQIRAHCRKYIFTNSDPTHIWTYKIEAKISQNNTLPAVLYSYIFYFLLYYI